MKNNNWITPLVITGLAIHTFNNKLFSISKDKLRKKEFEHKVFNWKFGPISYKEEGQGQPVLMIHDTFSGSSSIEFDRIIQQTSKKYKVYAIDLLGYGFSERANITYTAYLYIQLINDFIRDVIKENHISVITSGNSNIYALLTSQQDTTLISKCIMINPIDLRVAALNPSRRDHTVKYLLELPFLGTTLFNLVHSRLNFKQLFNKVHNKSSMKYYIDQFYHNAHYSDSSSKYAFASYISNYMNIDIREALKASNISLYIISGSDREVSTKTIHDQYTDHNPSIECVTIKGSSDFPHLENPFTTYDQIQLFLHD